jgi:peroxiredoxin
LNNRTLVLLSTVLAASVILFHFSVKKQPSGDEAKNLFESMSRPLKWQGRPAPDFTLDSLNGEKFTLSDQVGRKVIVLNFFATWCGPCKEETPEFVKYFEQHKNGPFLLIGIDADEPESAVRDFIRDFGVTYPVAIDRGGKLSRAFSVRALPTTVFIGADGVVQVYEVGEIRNADVAFDAPFSKSIETIKAGTGITKEAFLARKAQAGNEAQAATEQAAPEKGESDEPALTGRAKTIAGKMSCPCGCTHTLVECTCKTAKDIKDALRKRDWSSMSDEEAIKTLNREFCMK